VSSGIDQTLANAILDAMLPNSGTATLGTKTITGPTHTRFMTANGSDTSAGTELSGGSYVAGGISTTYAAAASGSKASNAAVTQTGMPAATVVGVELWDTSATPQRLLWGALTSNVTTAAGDTLTIASGNLTAALA
jgi:hypothetical protein